MQFQEIDGRACLRVVKEVDSNLITYSWKRHPDQLTTIAGHFSCHQYFTDHWIDGAGCIVTLLTLFSNNDICFPATTAHSLRAAVQARLLQGNMLSEPGIRHFLGSDARACVAIRM